MNRHLKANLAKIFSKTYHENVNLFNIFEITYDVKKTQIRYKIVVYIRHFNETSSAIIWNF